MHGVHQGTGSWLLGGTTVYLARPACWTQVNSFFLPGNGPTQIKKIVYKAPQGHFSIEDLPLS